MHVHQLCKVLLEVYVLHQRLLMLLNWQQVETVRIPSLWKGWKSL